MYKVIIVTVIATCPLTLFSQAVKKFHPESDSTFNVAIPDLVYIANYWTHPININLGYDQTTWTTFTIGQNPEQFFVEAQKGLYCKVCTSTDDNCLTFFLDKGKKYAVFWDDEEKKFIIGEL